MQLLFTGRSRDRKKASAKRCTSDITLAEFKQLTAKMDGLTGCEGMPEEYQNGTPRWRTDLYANSGTLMTHDESIALIRSLGAVHARTEGARSADASSTMTTLQEKYATQMLDAYKKAGIPPDDVCSPRVLISPAIPFW